MPWLYRNGPNWYVGWRANGRQYAYSTGTTDKTRAEVSLKRVELMLAAAKANCLNETYFQLKSGQPGGVASPQGVIFTPENSPENECLVAEQDYERWNHLEMRLRDFTVQCFDLNAGAWQICVEWSAVYIFLRAEGGKVNRDRRCVYVGESSHLSKRIGEHLGGARQFVSNELLVLRVQEEERKAIEELVIDCIPNSNRKARRDVPKSWEILERLYARKVR